MKIPVSEIDIFFISYDEPNAEMNWADLQGKAPWSKRIHGVHGSDAAHKEASRLSTTDRLITVDADNIVLDRFFKMEISFEGIYDYENKVYAWSGHNYINGLEYGNGGVKCWPKKFIENMRSHEIAKDKRNAVDFCWYENYNHINEVYSITYTNSSPLQAFRSGFREGVKMCLDQGVRMNKLEFSDKAYWQNIDRLLIWCNIGADVENGLWSIFGARMGVHEMLLNRDFDWIQIRDFSYLNILFNLYQHYKPDNLKQAIYDLGDILSNKLNLPMIKPDPEYSKFHKRIYKCQI